MLILNKIDTNYIKVKRTTATLSVGEIDYTWDHGWVG